MVLLLVSNMVCIHVVHGCVASPDNLGLDDLVSVPSDLVPSLFLDRQVHSIWNVNGQLLKTHLIKETG